MAETVVNPGRADYLAAAQHQKARLPVFQAILLFLSLGQIPVALFTRKPDLLD